uniref:Uncharacterized protein n=1 Tax=Acrobeloides nanus TaxID=290746 RepID=A0A914C1K3_9BILA
MRFITAGQHGQLMGRTRLVRGQHGHRVGWTRLVRGQDRHQWDGQGLSAVNTDINHTDKACLRSRRTSSGTDKGCPRSRRDGQGCCPLFIRMNKGRIPDTYP